MALEPVSKMGPTAQDLVRSILLILAGVLVVLLGYYNYWRPIGLAPPFSYDESCYALVALTDGRQSCIDGRTGWWFGMNAYTTSWPSYPAKILFEQIAPDWRLYRALFGGYTALGLSLIAMALSLRSQKRRWSGIFFLLISLSFPALLHQARAAFEVTGFFIFCVGLVSLGVSLTVVPVRWRRSAGAVLIGMGAIAGILAHALFLAPLLVLAVRGFRNHYFESRYWRSIAQILAVMIGIWFVRVAFYIPEVEKALGASTICFSIAIGVSVPACRQGLGRIISHRGFRIPTAVLGLVALVFVLCFSSAAWTLLVANGQIVHRWSVIGEAMVAAGWLGWAVWARVGAIENSAGESVISSRSQVLEDFFLLGLCCALLIIQPSPRCYVLSMLAIAAGLAWGIIHMNRLSACAAILLWVAIGTYNIQVNELKPVRDRHAKFKELKFLYVKGVSDLYPSVQDMLEMLANTGCDWSGVKLHSERLAKAFGYLSRDIALGGNIVDGVQKPRCDQATLDRLEISLGAVHP